MLCDAGWSVDGVMEWFPYTAHQAAVLACLLVGDTRDESLLLYLNLQHTHLPRQWWCRCLAALCSKGCRDTTHLASFSLIAKQ